jgi:ATP-dependent DNA helicase MPH1
VLRCAEDSYPNGKFETFVNGIRHSDLLQLQRVGRTGRKREGYVHVLLAEGREETNWNKAREAYNDVQRSIVRGEQLELYDDVERLLPEHIKPECLEMVMKIEEYDRSATEKARENIVNEPGKKRKRDSNPTRDIPPGACTGFVSVAELLVKQKVKRRKRTANFDENAGLDDETDEEIEAGLYAPRRAASTSAPSKPPKTNLKRAKTTADGSKTRRGATSKQKKARAGVDNTELTLSQLARKGAEDSDDMEIERGLWYPMPRKPPHLASGSGSSLSSSPDIPLAQNRSVIDICTSAAPSPSPNHKYQYSTPSRSCGIIPATQHTLLSPPKSPSVDPSDAVVALEPCFGSVSPSKGSLAQDMVPKKECEASKEDDSLAWLLADSDDAGASASSPAEPRIWGARSPGSDVVEIEDSEQDCESPIVLISSPVRTSEPSTIPNREMPPPAIPLRRLRPSPSSPAAPSPTLPVRAAGRTKKGSAITQVADSSSPPRPPPPSQKRLHRRHSHNSHSPSPPPRRPTSPPRKKKKRTKIKLRDTAEAARLNPWIDVEAAHSGDEVSSGGDRQLSTSPLSSSGLGLGEESDRRFVTDLPATQASPSYDQSAIYRQSLLSQPAAGCKLSVPLFAAPPTMRSRGAIGVALPRRERSAAGVVWSSSPPAPPDEEDYYLLGSFVVDDEAEISFVQSSEP